MSSDDEGHTRKLGLLQYLGYGAGDAANNLTFSMISAFLLIYYIDVAFIPAAAAGTLFLVVRIWGGFTDLLAGRRVDQTETRWGRFRPYLLFGSVPLLLLLVAVFTVPTGWSLGAKITYAYVSYALFQLAYSFVNIPYGSLSAAMTQAPDERSKLSSYRVVFTSLTILLLAVVISPQLKNSANLQVSLTITTLVFAVIGMACYLFTFLTSREQVERSPQTASLQETLSMLRLNQPLIVLCLSCLLFLTGMFTLQTVAVFYAVNVLGNANLYIVMTVVGTVAMIFASMLVPSVAVAMGKKRAYILGCAISVVAGVALALAPSSTPAIGITCYGILSIGLGLVNTLIFAMQADTVEYGEWRTGVRGEASVYSVLSFTRKAGQGVGGAAASFTLGLGGYVSTTVRQPPEAIAAIKIAAGIIPAAAILIGGLIMLGYPLTENVFRRIVREIAARRAHQISVAVAGAAG
ncbi:MAG TPA: glycoside-pentoside-hexuronide (GPH):cation symporter [Ktedonobacterales bacterium]